MQLTMVSTCCLAIALMASGPAAANDDECRAPVGVEFAHCAKVDHNFKTLLLAVHGWNGSCAETFGKRKTSLYSVLGDRQRFYDWDCFQYDSLGTSIRENASKLRARLQQLKSLGYEKVALVTHSTGGILALQVLGDLLAETPPNRLWVETPRVVEVDAWATPINGLRTDVGALGRVLVGLGFSPKTLPDLSPDSRYLKDLKTRWRQANQTYLRSAPVAQGQRRIEMYFYQGQGRDMVVRGIDHDQALHEGWFLSDSPEELWHLVDSREGHTHNVGESGTESRSGPSTGSSSSITPRYAAEILKSHTLLALGVRPRFEIVFPDPPPAPFSRSFEQRQELVVSGLTYFASKNFTGAFTPALDFLARMYDGSFERSSQVDEKLVQGFLAAVQRRAAEPDPDLMRFFAEFVRRVLAGYDPASGEDITRFGHRHSGVVQKVLDTAEVIRHAVNTYLAGHPERGDQLAGFRSPDEFNSQLLKMTSRFLDSGYQPVQRRTLSILAQAVPSSSSRAVIDSGVVAKLADFYRSGNYRLLDAKSKSDVVTIYADMLRREPQIGTAALASLNSTVVSQGMTRPLWTSLSHDPAAAQSLVAAVAVNPGANPQEKVRFLTEVTARAGAVGNDKALASKAVDLTTTLIRDTHDGGLHRQFAAELQTAGARSKYPAIQSKVLALAEPP